MNERSKVLVINSSFPEVNHLAAAFAELGLLSCYVRPYANFGRAWEHGIGRIPGFGRAYSRTFGRRILPQPLSNKNVFEVAIGLDFALAIHHRLPIKSAWYRNIRSEIIYKLDDVIAEAGANKLSDESMVVASWHCALPAFEKAAQRGSVRVLNYPLAHHEFTHRYLLEEAELEPGFASTLNSHDRPQWQIDRLDREISLSDRILVGSTFVKDSFIAEGISEDKITVVPYGVDTSLFRPPERLSQPDTFNVLFVGQLSQRKGISYLLRAYERFNEADTTLTMIGQVQDDGAALKPWQHLFTHISHIPRSELARRFQQADVFVFPTLVEGMPIVVIEAMASGLPVITTRNGPGDIVRDGVDGFIVPPRDPDAIQERLVQLKSNHELRIHMGENARKRAQEYTWEIYRRGVVSNLHDWIEQGNVAKRG